MNPFGALRRWHQTRAGMDDLARHGLAMSEIRFHLAAFGFPMDDVSDAQIEAAVVRFARLAAASGCSWNEAIHHLAILRSGPYFDEPVRR